MTEQEEILIEVNKNFDVAITGVISKEKILEELEIKISHLLQRNAETFFQLMYRLDISEKKLTAAIEDNEHTVARIANLIYERQEQKILSRKQYRSPDSEEKELLW